MKLPISEITIGTRRREDYGDLQTLADSIAKYGLLHPIVVNDSNNLVAGGRRLEAAKLLGWNEIEVTRLGELLEAQLREIELEENLRRKDLTEIEKSRNMVALAEIKAEVLRRDFSQPSSEKSGDQSNCAPGAQKVGHRLKQADSIRTIANEIGVPESTLRLAQQHVQSVNSYPILETLQKKEAIQTAKKLDSLPPEVRPAVIETIKQETEPEPDLTEKHELPTGEPPEETEEERRRREVFAKAERFKVGVDRLVDRLHILSGKDPEFYFGGLDKIDWAFSKISVFAEAHLAVMDDAIRFLVGLRRLYAERVANIKENPQGIKVVK